MFVKQDMKTSIYYIGDKFMVDIIDNGINYEAWIYNSDYGIKMFMFGISKDSNRPNGKRMNVNDFIEIVKNNIEDYRTTYKNEYVSGC